MSPVRVPRQGFQQLSFVVDGISPLPDSEQRLPGGHFRILNGSLPVLELTGNATQVKLKKKKE